MRVTIPVDEAALDAFLPPAKPDGSGIGVNYADQVLKQLKQTLQDGRKLAAKRRGLKVTVTIGESAGEAIMRRLEHGPDPRTIFERALVEAARGAGATLSREPGVVHLDF
ncbi:MAG: hypothetical protein FIB04_14510 [Gammaproteobacteria bacterium]|nr:hypothetical protein [Gammaproteobacteria bacterium]